MNKRTHSSVTETPCKCRYLETAADDPDVPIVFDEETAEYQFQYDEQRSTRMQSLSRAIWNTEPQHAMLVIYHCPFCGGAAPESKRHLLFETIPRDEESRLADLLQNITTIEDAIKQLGTPDMDDHSVTRTSESVGNPSKIEHHREIHYYNLSEVADVWITERPDGSMYWRLHGKYKGLRNGI